MSKLNKEQISSLINQGTLCETGVVYEDLDTPQVQEYITKVGVSLDPGYPRFICHSIEMGGNNNEITVAEYQGNISFAAETTWDGLVENGTIPAEELAAQFRVVAVAAPGGSLYVLQNPRVVYEGSGHYTVEADGSNKGTQDLCVITDGRIGNPITLTITGPDEGSEEAE